ncbi:MAG: histidine phosphatase family protein [Eubacteriaceae bacterium]|nr:histidine phosphatase family protein [Eubacteriaceae bacterium]
MKFYLVRHVETTGNVENRFAGVTETEYTEKGRKQFQILTERLINEFAFDSIYSSPISRANKIAVKVGQAKNIQVEVRKELSEMNFGVFENYRFEEIKEIHTEYWNKWNEDYVNYQIPQGDSLIEFHSRITEFLDSMKHKDGAALIVCHGGTIQSILTHLLGLKIEDRWHFHIPLAGLVEIKYENDYGMMNNLKRLADIDE